MKVVKCLPIGTLIWLLGACSLFDSTPQKVVDGQRGAYQGLLVIDDNIKQILDTYETDNKAAVVYHLNFVYEQKIDAIRKNDALSDKERLGVIAELESSRTTELTEALHKIEKKKRAMLEQVDQNVFASKKLVEAVYNYMSTTPITVDNVDFWILKMSEVNRGR